MMVLPATLPCWSSTGRSASVLWSLESTRKRLNVSAKGDQKLVTMAGLLVRSPAAPMLTLLLGPDGGPIGGCLWPGFPTVDAADSYPSSNTYPLLPSRDGARFRPASRDEDRGGLRMPLRLSELPDGP